MKKFVIKNANGSEQYVMPVIHNTRKEALLTILDYIEDDSQIGEYIVEEVDMKDVNEEITDYESALKSIGPTGFWHVRTVENAKALIALNKLFTIATAWNKSDGFVPDFSNWSQDKWTPVFEQTALTKRLELSTVCLFAKVNESFGPRLCFKTRERAWQFGTQFLDLYNQVFLS